MKPIKLSALLLVLLLLLSACTVPSQSAATDPLPAGTDAQQTDAPSVPQTEPQQTETESAAPIETETPSTEPIETGIPPEERPTAELETLPEPRPARDYAEVLRFLGTYDYTALPARDPGEEDPYSGDSGIELTNFEPEVPGVVRPERICADGGYIYMLDSYGLTILSADGKNSRMLCSIPVEREPNAYLEEMFAAGDRVGIIYTCSSFGQDEDGGWYDVSSTHLVVYDVSNRSDPVRLRDSGVDGSYLGAGMMDGTVCLLTNRYFWSVDPDGVPESIAPGVTQDGKTEKIPAERILICPNPNSTALTVAAAVSLETGALLDSLAFTDASSSVYLEADGIWLGRQVLQYGVSASYQDGGYTVQTHKARTRTELRHLSLDDGLSFDGSCLIDGAVSCRSGLGRTEGGLCAVTALQELNWSSYTDEARGWINVAWGETLRGGLLTVLDDNLEPVCVMKHPAQDGKITDCRYSGGLVLLLTGGEDGAVWPVDLTDPAAPTASEPLSDVRPEELSAFLRDGSLLCIGAGKNGLQLRLLEPDGEGSLRTLAGTVLDGVTGTPAQTDGSLLLADDAGGWLGFAADGSAETGYRYLLLSRSEDGFGRPVEFSLSYLPTNARGLLLDGLLYICSPGTTYVADPERGTILTTVTNAEG